MKSGLFEQNACEPAESTPPFAEIVDFIPDPCFAIDLQGKVIAWNRAIAELTGIDSVNMIGKGDYEYSIPFYGIRRPILIDLVLNWTEETAKTYKYVRKKDDIIVSEIENPPFRQEPALFWNSAQKIYNSIGKCIGAIEVIRDISERKRFEEALRHRFSFEQLVARISTQLANVSPKQLDHTIETVLVDMGRSTGVDRSCLVQFSEDLTTSRKTQEWCAAGIKPEIQNLQDTSMVPLKWLMSRLCAGENIIIQSVAELPQEAQAEKEWLQAQDILSLLAVPVFCGQALFGFIGFDSVQEEKEWINEDIQLLRTASEAIGNAIQRANNEKELRQSENKFSKAFHNSPSFLFISDFQTGEFISVNKAYCDLTGYSAEELIGKTSLDLQLLTPQQRNEMIRELHRCGFVKNHENCIRRKNGDVRTRIFSAELIELQEKTCIVASGIDITERKQADEERDTSVEFLQIVNKCKDMDKLVRTVTKFLQHKCSCDAVGIRLKREHDYPYYEARGFSEEFVLSEDSLCRHDLKGNPVCDSQGNLVLECMCGNIFMGRYNPDIPFFTRNGSFWTNSTTELLASTSEPGGRVCTHNCFRGDGYESVSLIPLRIGDRCLGLLQMNDKRKGRFTPDRIALWERLAHYLAIALSKFMTEQDLRESEHRYKQLFNAMQEGFGLAQIIVDASGKPCNYRLLEVNNAFGQLLGISLETAKTKTALELVPNLEPHWIEIFGRVASTGMAEHFEAESPALGKWFEVYAFSPEQGKFATLFVDITERKQAEEALLRMNETLEQQVAQRTAELKRRNREIQDLAHMTIRAMENDRKALSKELHDSVGGTLAAIKYQLESRVEAVGPPPPSIQLPLEKIITYLGDAIQESRRMTKQLRPSVLDDFGLVAALEEHISDFQKFHPGKNVLKHISIIEEELSNDAKTVLYRVLQEALNNVGKHSMSDRVDIQCYRSKGRVILKIQDNGVGFNADEMIRAANVMEGYGLYSMKERVEICKGELGIESSLGNGTIIMASIPLDYN